jgi:hypothetical protein
MRHAIALLLLITTLGCGDSGDGTADTPTTDPGVPLAPPMERAPLQLQLVKGDRFPLRKVVEQELAQSFPGIAGRAPETSRTRLEMLLAITVEDIQNGVTRMGVRYDRIRYSRDVRGEQLEFDSAHPPVAVPLELAVYQGMIGRGFSFWIGADNRIARVEGFAEFIKSALASVPPESRDEVLLGAESGTGEDGVADFVDDTIGLLPYDAPKAVGDTWRRERHVARPVPMHIDTLCTLRDLTTETAVVDVRGEVTPALTTGIQTVAHQSMSMVVERGSTTGECVLFRDTGLPKESRIVQDVEMSVNVLGKAPVKQRKKVVTTIESYPAMRAKQ